MSAGGGGRAVVAALSANLGIAVIKFVAFAITGSSSMLAEGVHSVVDSGNQVLLLVGGRRARRRATPEHPFGYGRDRYVYGFLVALMLFSAGGLFALYEGVEKIRHPHHLDNPLVAGAQTSKYRAARIFQDYPAQPESLPAVVARLRAAGINAVQTSNDKIDFGDGFGPIDVIQGARPGGGDGWQWLPVNEA